jgi:hypothetical protein
MMHEMRSGGGCGALALLVLALRQPKEQRRVFLKSRDFFSRKKILQIS